MRSSLSHALAVSGLVLLAALPLCAQPRPRETNDIDVQRYYIRAKVNPDTQTLTAEVDVVIHPIGREITSATFELNDALTVSKVVGADQQPIAFSRDPGHHTIHLTFAQPLKSNQPFGITFNYDGQLTGAEESPVYGVRFAEIAQNFAYLLYPSRWFPISGYTVDRYSADMEITVPAGFKVIASGNQTGEETTADGVTYKFSYNQPSFPGSIAVVKDNPQQVSASGVNTTVYFRGQDAGMANGYGRETGEVMTYLTSVFGLPPEANLTLVETSDGAPNGYAAPGIIFLAPGSIGTEVNQRLLANMVAREWWGILLSPRTRDHLWITNGMSKYAEVLYLGHVNGDAWVDNEIHDINVEALTVTEPPVIQAARLDDYSPELVALTFDKGAAVLHMLRGIMGDESFMKLLKDIPDKFAWKEIDTADFRKEASALAGQNLDYFFLQWIESQGAPEFRLEYTVYRTQKGFRVMGKVKQDLDLFRMPVKVRVETEGNPEEATVEVVGTSSEFSIDTFGKPKKIILNPDHQVLAFDDQMRIAVAIRRGEQFAEIGQLNDALNEYQKALDVKRNSSLAHYRVAEAFFLQNNYQSAANEFREALAGDLDPKWTEVWAHINLGKIFDITSQRERAVNEYRLALRTKDNTQGAQEIAAKYLKDPYQRVSGD